jgi:hypothetical protein
LHGVAGRLAHAGRLGLRIEAAAAAAAATTAEASEATEAAIGADELQRFLEADRIPRFFDGVGGNASPTNV